MCQLWKHSSFFGIPLRRSTRGTTSKSSKKRRRPRRRAAPARATALRSKARRAKSLQCHLRLLTLRQIRPKATVNPSPAVATLTKSPFVAASLPRAACLPRAASLRRAAHCQAAARKMRELGRHMFARAPLQRTGLICGKRDISTSLTISTPSTSG